MTEGEHVAQRNEACDAVDPLLKAIGRQIKVLRERAGLTQTELGERIGYGVDLVSSVERGRRAPKPQFIAGAERVLDAGGLLDAVRDDVERARLPSRFRDFARWEKDAFKPVRVRASHRPRAAADGEIRASADAQPLPTS